jgi:hypothetical protein
LGRTSGHLARTGTAGYREALNQRGVAPWRIAVAIGILGSLIFFCALLFRPYLQNYRLQSYVEKVAFDAEQMKQPEAIVAASVAEHAARLGLPVSFDQVRVSKSGPTLYIEVRYFVRVDLALYTVDLHFRPAAGVR